MNNEHIINECTKNGLDAEETKEVITNMSHCTCENCETTLSSAIENNRKTLFTQEIPEEQINLVRTAITHYLSALETIDSGDSELGYRIFDLNQLKSMLLYPVTIKIDEKSKNTFSSKHGQDFPEYSGDHQLKEVKHNSKIKKELLDFMIQIANSANRVVVDKAVNLIINNL
jgi:hypothetical protein